MIAAGLNDDPRPMISRLNDLLTKALEKHWRLLHPELWGLTRFWSRWRADWSWTTVWAAMSNGNSSILKLWKTQCSHLFCLSAFDIYKMVLKLQLMVTHYWSPLIFGSFGTIPIIWFPRIWRPELLNKMQNLYQVDFVSMSAHSPSEGFTHANTGFCKEHLMCFRVKRHL